MKPITPKQASEANKTELPEYVIKAVNDLIVEHYYPKGFQLHQDKVVNKIITVAQYEYNILVTREEIFSKKFLDFESYYNSVGWVVDYEKAPYYSPHDSHYKFQVGRPSLNVL